MLQDIFAKRKQAILAKQDKSSKGKWDEKIAGLCDKINKLDNYYTTSSCAGRVVLMINQDKKQKGLFLKVYHGLISFNQLKKDLEGIIKNQIPQTTPNHPPKSAKARYRKSKFKY